MLRLLIRLYESAPTSDWVSICQCLMFLDDAPEVAKILHNLLKGSEVSPGWCLMHLYFAQPMGLCQQVLGC